MMGFVSLSVCLINGRLFSRIAGFVSFFFFVSVSRLLVWWMIELRWLYYEYLWADLRKMDKWFFKTRKTKFSFTIFSVSGLPHWFSNEYFCRSCLWFLKFGSVVGFIDVILLTNHLLDIHFPSPSFWIIMWWISIFNIMLYSTCLFSLRHFICLCS